MDFKDSRLSKIKYFTGGMLAVSLLVFVLWLIQTDSYIPHKKEIVVDTIVPPPPKLLYDLRVDSFRVATHRVSNNQFLADILLGEGIDYQIIDRIVSVSKPYFDFRKLRTGNSYSLFHSKDSLSSLKHFIYEIDDIHFVSIAVSDSIAVEMGEKEVVAIGKTASGEIRSSLWKTIQDQNFNPMLAIGLSEVFAWTVDFFGIEKGDFFKVIYDEQFVDGKSIGIGAIHSAVFMHKGHAYYAFRFKEDSVWDFFDENGQSLRKAFLKAPLRFSRISSKFSNSRFHPILKIRRAHYGVDYAAPTGTAVYSIGDGTVLIKGWDPKGGGNYMKIRHNSVYTTTYMHLSGFAKGISNGLFVKQGQIIAYVGSTGLASGPHLDFRVFRNGSPIDPLKVESPPVEPVKPEHMARYQQYIIPHRQSIDQIVVE